MNEFKSPLASSGVSPFGAWDFGVPVLPPALQALRHTLQVRLNASMARLPPAMQEEALGIIAAYSGPAPDFYGLYYQPVWSFLHWVVVAAAEPVPATIVDDAITTQAMALFLHLWDDHLCDGQLPTTQLSLQVRTDAWAAYLAAANRLALRVGAAQADVDGHVSTYLSAIHAAEPIDNLNDFCTRFERQIAIWTLVPRLIGRAVNGPQTGEALAAVLTAFCKAWRLMDDLQDVEDDVLAGVESAAWQVLDAPSRAAWAACHTLSKPLGHLHPESWALLQQRINEGGYIARLLALCCDWLDSAAALAQANHWQPLADEIRAHRPPTIGRPTA